MDIIKQQQKAEREEEERIKREQERQYRLEQEKLKQTTTTNENDEEEEEEKVEGKTTTTEEEYLVYICQCCNKMFKTTNAFKNHTDVSKGEENLLDICFKLFILMVNKLTYTHSLISLFF